MAEPTNPDEQIRKSLDDWADGVLTDRELIGKVQQAVNWQTPNGWIEISGGTGPVESARGSGKIIGKPNPSEQIDAVMVLTDDEVAEIESVNKVYRVDWRYPNHRERIDALCATVRALSEKHARLAEVSGEWATLLDRVRLWSKCEDGYPLDEHINNITTQNTALREQLAELRSHLREQQETIKFWQRHIARMGKLLGTIAMDSEVETAVKQLQSQLAQVTQERQKWKRCAEKWSRDKDEMLKDFTEAMRKL